MFHNEGNVYYDVFGFRTLPEDLKSSGSFLKLKTDCATPQKKCERKFVTWKQTR